MQQKNTIVLILISLLLSSLSMAQNMTSSPFSRYAYGDLNDNVPTVFLPLELI